MMLITVIKTMIKIIKLIIVEILKKKKKIKLTIIILITILMIIILKIPVLLLMMIMTNNNDNNNSNNSNYSVLPQGREGKESCTVCTTVRKPQLAFIHLVTRTSTLVRTKAFELNEQP